jgi:hypothetical protein
MGSSGHAFIAHTKALSPRAQLKDGGFGLPPHPVAVRPGQRYWPRSGRGREVWTVRRIEGEDVILEGAGHVQKRLRSDRLLGVRDDGQGRYFQFQGFAPKRYATFACVVSLSEEGAVLCLPEWHPRRPVPFPVRLLPPTARAASAWLSVHCDLSASSAGRLQLSELTGTATTRVDMALIKQLTEAVKPNENAQAT